MIKYFYKIDEGKLTIGSGKTIPEAFIQYTKDENECILSPKELVDFLELEKVNKDVEKKVEEAKEYLASTDWYCARKVDTGEEIPTEVVSKRAEAREYIREVEDGK